MQKGKEKPRYVGQCVTYDNMPKSAQRIRKRKTYKGSERNLTFYPVISVIDKYRIFKIDNVFLSLLSILNKHTEIDLKEINSFNQDQLISFLNLKMNNLLKEEREFYNFDNITFNGKSIILYTEESEMGNCFTLDCIHNVDDENLKKIIRYVVGALIIKYKFPTISSCFDSTVDYYFSADNENLEVDGTEDEYRLSFNKEINLCINEFINGNNDWHHEYIMEMPNHTAQIKIILELINHYKTYSCNDFSFDLLLYDELTNDNAESISYENYNCIVPKNDSVFDEYEVHLNDYWNNYKFQSLVYKKEYSLDGIKSTIKYNDTYNYIKKIISILWKI
jgi:hypothetical protein